VRAAACSAWRSIQGPTSPYTSSPRMGCPWWARCTRIWWVRPVSGSHCITQAPLRQQATPHHSVHAWGQRDGSIALHGMAWAAEWHCHTDTHVPLGRKTWAELAAASSCSPFCSSAFSLHLLGRMPTNQRLTFCPSPGWEAVWVCGQGGSSARAQVSPRAGCYHSEVGHRRLACGGHAPCNPASNTIVIEPRRAEGTSENTSGSSCSGSTSPKGGTQAQPQLGVGMLRGAL
jgi:hypothetical protein